MPEETTVSEPSHSPQWSVSRLLSICRFHKQTLATKRHRSPYGWLLCMNSDSMEGTIGESSEVHPYQLLNDKLPRGTDVLPLEEEPAPCTQELS